MQIHLKELTLLPIAMCFLLIVHTAISFGVFSFLSPLSYLSLFLLFISFFCMLALYAMKPLMTTFGLSMISFCTLLITFSLINGTDVKSSIFKSIEVWLLLLLFNYYQDKAYILLKAIAFSFSCCIYLNLAIMVLFPDWIFAADDTFDSFLLGGNYNQMGCRFITGIATNFLCVRYGWKWLINSIVISIVSIVSLILVGSMTALSTTSLFIFCCLIPSVRTQKIIAFGYFFFYVLFHLFVVFSGISLHNNELAVYFVEDVLGKDITFTYRTEMWDSALRVISQSPIIGYGFVDKDWYLANMSTFAIGPHNFVLSLFINGGLILFGIFVWSFVIAISRLLRCTSRTSVLLLLAIVSLLFTMSFEVYPFIFIILLLTIAFYFPQTDQDSYEHNHTNK